MLVGVRVGVECKRAGGGVFSAASGSRRNDRWDVYGESEEKEAPPMGAFIGDRARLFQIVLWTLL